MIRVTLCVVVFLFANLVVAVFSWPYCNSYNTIGTFIVYY